MIVLPCRRLVTADGYDNTSPWRRARLPAAGESKSPNLLSKNILQHEHWRSNARRPSRRAPPVSEPISPARVADFARIRGLQRPKNPKFGTFGCVQFPAEIWAIWSKIADFVGFSVWEGLQF
jgi:hypothetical protein